MNTDFDRKIDLMDAFTDLPDDMILEAAWKEDEIPTGESETSEGIGRRWLPLCISIAAALVLGLISWRLFSDNSREMIDTTGTTEAVGNEVSSEYTEPDESTASKSHVSLSKTLPTEATEPKTPDTTESAGEQQEPEVPDKPEETTPKEEPHRTENTSEENGSGISGMSNMKGDPDQDPSSGEPNEAGSPKSKDKFEAENELLRYFAPEHSVSADPSAGVQNLPDSFGGTVNYLSDGLMHVYATTPEAIADYQEVLKDYPAVIYHMVDYSYQELKKSEALILEHRNEFKRLETEVAVEYNKVFVDVQADEYERMQALVQDMPAVVRIYGTGDVKEEDIPVLVGEYEGAGQEQLTQNVEQEVNDEE